MRIKAEPRSDQLNADDFISNTQTYAIAGVTEGKAEAKYDVALVGEARCWRPPLTILRLLMEAWGDEADKWVGRMVTLYRDSTVQNMGQVVGGIRVSHMSDLPTGDKPFMVKVTVSQGKKGPLTVQPLARIDALKCEWRTADPERRAAIEAEVKALNTTNKESA